MIEKIRSEAESLLADIKGIEELEALRVRFLGKKGEITSVLRGLGSVSPEERPVIGQYANEVREKIESAISAKKEEL